MPITLLVIASQVCFSHACMACVQEPSEALRDHFGFGTFLNGQEEVVVKGISMRAGFIARGGWCARISKMAFRYRRYHMFIVWERIQSFDSGRSRIFSDHRFGYQPVNPPDSGMWGKVPFVVFSRL